MEPSIDDLAEILIPHLVGRHADFFKTINREWLDWARDEINSGVSIQYTPGSTHPSENASYVIYYVRLFNVADILYTAVNGKGLSEITFLTIAQKAFEYCEIDSKKTGHSAVHSARHITANWYHQIATSFPANITKLTFKGRKAVRSVPDYTEPPPIILSAFSRPESQTKDRQTPHTFPSQQYFYDAGFIPHYIIGYGWYAEDDEGLKQKLDAVQNVFNTGDEAPLHDPIRQIGWYFQQKYFFLFDVVTLEKFLFDFDSYSEKCLRPQSEDARKLEMLGFRNEAIKRQRQVRESEIIARREELVKAMRDAAIQQKDFFCAGRQFIADASVSDALFCRVFLDIKRLCRWLIYESGLDQEWIPFPIRDWVRDENVPVTGPSDIPHADRRKGREMQLQFDEVWAILGQQQRVTDDWFERAKSELESGGAIQSPLADSDLIEEFNRQIIPANTVCWVSRTPKFYATEYSRLSMNQLFVVVSSTPDPKRINTRSQFNDSRIEQDTPFFWLITNRRQYKLDDVLLYFFRVILVAQAFTPLSNLPRLLDTAKRAFDFFGIIRRDGQTLDPDGVCSDMQTLAEYFDYATEKDGVLELTQKGRVFLREKNVDLNWPQIVNEKTGSTESTVVANESSSPIITNSHIRVHFVFDTANQLLQLTVDGAPVPKTGRFADGSKLLRTLWNAPNHRLAKSDFDRIHPDIRFKGKQQLSDIIGAAVFGLVYQDDVRGGDMWLTDAILVDVQSTGKR